MNGHVTERIVPFIDNELDAAECARVDAHLIACDECRIAVDRARAVAAAIAALPLVEAPRELDDAMAAAFAARSTHTPRPVFDWLRRPAVAAAAVAVLALSAAMVWWIVGRTGEPVDIARISAAGEERLHVGDWVAAGESPARMRIGQIGSVDVAAGTRVQVLDSEPGQHRLRLPGGRISVQIVAPPRIFFVETPVSTVVDLGCAYTMEVDQDGNGVLQVTSGWAALEWNGRESLVPAGASCPTRPGVGPGTPVFDDATETMHRAMRHFDFDDGGQEALDVVLAEARDRDTLTLWHLMSRVDEPERVRVLERIESLVPLPQGIDRDMALSLDPGTMQRWREELAWTW